MGLSTVPALLSGLPSCSLVRQLYRSSTWGRLFTKIGATEVLLFYRVFPAKRVTIRPNQRASDCCCLRVDDIGKSIVAAAKEIVIKQRISSKRNPEEEEKGGFQLRVDSRLQGLED